MLISGTSINTGRDQNIPLLGKESKTKELGWDELRCKWNSPLSAGDQRTMGTKQVGLPGEAVGGYTHSLVALALTCTLVG